MYYYKEQMIISPRFFTVGGKSKVEFQLGDDTYIVDGSEVVDYDKMNELRNARQEAKPSKEEPQDVAPKKEQEIKEEPESVEEDVVEEEKEQVEETVEEFETIVATNVKTKKEKKLTTQTEYDNFVKQYKLDSTVIEDVLAGNQKTHKGFSFSK